MLTLPDVEYEQWHRFHVVGDHAPVGNEAATYRRWERITRFANGGPSWTERRFVRIADLRAVQSRLAPILHRARDVLSSAIDELTRRGFVVVLANQDGVILASWGTPALIDASYRAEFMVGTRWDEETRGTNAIGTALAEHRAVSVIGRAHYLEQAHKLACYAALIENPADDSVIVLDITGPAGQADPLLGVLVVSLAGTLEGALHASSAAVPPMLPAVSVLERSLSSDRDRFLAEASVTLGASLDLEETVSALGRLCLESIADWCIIDLADGGGGLVRACVMTRLADKRLVAEALHHERIENHRPYLQLSAIEQRQPVIVRSVTPQLLDAVARSPRHREMIEQMALESLMAVPLMAGDTIVGALLCGSSQQARRYGARDAQLASELARRGALAIANARLHRAVQEAADARAEVLAIVAHDLRGPLNTIGVSSELLQHRHAIGDTDRSMRSIQRSTKQMGRLIEDLLDASRREDDRLVLETQPVDPTALVEDVLELARPLLTGRDIDVDVAPTPEVRADRERLLQVLMNFVGNAVKFTARDATITISVRADGDHVRFAVADTGPGLDPEQTPHVFERFWKGRRTDRRGAGLGLFISRRIVEDHGGHIGVESTPGAGAMFWFTVPCANC